MKIVKQVSVKITVLRKRQNWTKELNYEINDLLISLKRIQLITQDSQSFKIYLVKKLDAYRQK